MVKRTAAAFVMAAILSGGLTIGRSVHAEGMSPGSGDLACVFASGIVAKFPDRIQATMATLFGSLLGCTVTYPQ
jgi:hypothetical protein